MAKRPTITDLARISGVSVATVDRVLNNRLPVREETARRVYEAATSIGYHAAGLIKQRMRQE
ncbi:MAG: LacI family transcriptional regulator, partial [Mesorhizobium sp.]